MALVHGDARSQRGIPYDRNVVVIGGGTGTYTASRGLKNYTRPTVIVSMADDGGSTGRLRDSYGILPPGDVRRNLVALADDDDQTLRHLFEYRFTGNGSLYGKPVDDLLFEALKDIVGNENAGAARESLFNPEQYGSVIVRRLRNYKFGKEDGVNGHSLGNLILTALTGITGSYVEAIRIASRILNISGRVLPVTIDDTRLAAVLDDHQLIHGETHIDIPKHDTQRRIERIYLIPKASLYHEAEQAILDGDLIVLGPGDLWSSVLANTVVDGVPEVLVEARASGAKVAYVCNLVTEDGETNEFTAGDHVEKILGHVGRVVDIVLCNNRGVSSKLLGRYAAEGRHPVRVDSDRIRSFGVELIETDLIEDEETEAQLLRHDSDKLARLLMSL